MNLANVPTSPPGPRYCLPSNLLLDEKERDAFLTSKTLDAASKRSVGTRGLNVLGRLDQYFPVTRDAIDRFLQPIGCKVYQINLFIVEPYVQSHKIHCDGVMWKGEPTMVDARLNFFHISPGPGIIAWWEQKIPMHIDIVPVRIGDQVVAHTCGWFSDWSQNWPGWESIPDPDHACVTDMPSAFIKTSIPHTVLHGARKRITVSAMLIDQDNDTPDGVFEKIRQLMGV